MTYEIKYRPEDEMKDSSIEWLGKVPEEWEIIRLRYLADIDTGNKDTQDKVDDGLYPFYVRSDIVERINSYSYDGEAILTAGDGVGVGRVFHYVKGKFAYHQRVYKLSKFKNIQGKYLYYYVSENFHKEVMKLSAKSTVDSLRRPMFNNFPVVLPDINNQQKIANFLDIKTAEFDSLISKKELLLEKLEEAKKSLISEVVTGKVKIVNGELVERKPDEMKDSGIEWLGMIPKDWEVTKLKYVSKLNMGQSPDSNSINQDGLGMPFLQGKSEFGTKYPQAINYCTKLRKKSLRGEILISVRAPVGDLNFSDREYCIGRGLASIGSSENIDYIYYFMLAYKDILRSYSTGSTFEAVSIGQIENFNIIKTDVETKNMIARFLNIKSKNINSIITKTKLQIEKLKEAKQSLISEAVTGKIDLRDWEIEGI